MYNIADSLKKHRLYADFVKVRDRLAGAQFVCWLVGGAVRDFALGLTPPEFDLVTDATTENLKALFPEAVLVGESFGVLKIPAASSPGDFFDLGTFRQESDYVDGRRPSQISASTPGQDALRRDFSVNALYWDDLGHRTISFGTGFEDLENRLLLCVGDPAVRFAEDHLRLLRLVRFAAQLGFRIDSATEAAARRLKSRVRKVSGERIWAELKKISAAGAWERAFRQPLFGELLEEIFGIKAEVTARPGLFLQVYSLAPQTDLTELLKKRLKLSRKELELYKAVRFWLGPAKDLSPGELAYEMEKSEILRAQFAELQRAGLLGFSPFSEAKKLLDTHPVPLIKAQDLLDLVPSVKISQELRFLRISQFNGGHKSKDEMRGYLKQKYAGESEKP